MALEVTLFYIYHSRSGHGPLIAVDAFGAPQQPPVKSVKISLLLNILSMYFGGCSFTVVSVRNAEVNGRGL